MMIFLRWISVLGLGGFLLICVTGAVGQVHSGPAVKAQSGAAVPKKSGAVQEQPPVDYPSVKIAGLWWMQENLAVTRYRNGDSIPDATNDRRAWAGLSNGAWAYPDSNASLQSTFGILYNGYAVADPRGICPLGWRLPTHDEWTALTNALGGETKAGAKLKGKVGWFPDLEGRDELGFQGLPAGFRGSDGTFGGAGAFAYWWSSTGSGINGTWGRFVDGTQPGIFMMDGFKKSAFSVRCVRKEGTGKARTAR
jgi:uncharacterized protein (TIGR02145 family)